MTSRRAALPVLAACSLAVLGLACETMLGIEDAYRVEKLTPTDVGGNDAGVAHGEDGVAAPVCTHFDNQRVTRLEPDGTLTPLPPSPP